MDRPGADGGPGKERGKIETPSRGFFRRKGNVGLRKGKNWEDQKGGDLLGGNCALKLYEGAVGAAMGGGEKNKSNAEVALSFLENASKSMQGVTRGRPK